MNAGPNEKIPFWGKNFIFYIYSVMLGVFGALGFYCAIMFMAITAFNEAGRSPIAYPFSVLAGFASLLICIGIFTAYVANFKFMRKRIQVILHLLILLAVFIGGVFTWSFLHTVISEIIRPY